MLRGSSTLEVSHQTMVDALQRYFDEVLFREGKSPIIKSVAAAGNSGYGASDFKLTLSEPPAPTAAAPAASAS